MREAEPLEGSLDLRVCNVGLLTVMPSCSGEDWNALLKAAFAVQVSKWTLHIAPVDRTIVILLSFRS